MPNSTRAAFLVLVGLSITVRFAAALLQRTPLYFPDEYLYQSLARGLAHGHVALVRGQHVTTSQTVSYFEPLVTAPLWLLRDVDLSYRLTQLLGSVAFSCSALPAFVLARRVGVDARSSLFVAALALAVPAGIFSGALMPQLYAYPAFLGVLLLALDTVERPSAGRVALTGVSAVALMFVGGLQFAFVLPALVVAGLSVLGTRYRGALVAGLLLFAGTGVLGARFAGQGVATFDGSSAPDALAAVDAMLRPDGSITERSGTSIAGPSSQAPRHSQSPGAATAGSPSSERRSTHSRSAWTGTTAPWEYTRASWWPAARRGRIFGSACGATARRLSPFSATGRIAASRSAPARWESDCTRRPERPWSATSIRKAGG